VSLKLFFLLDKEFDVLFQSGTEVKHTVSQKFAIQLLAIAVFGIGLAFGAGIGSVRSHVAALRVLKVIGVDEFAHAQPLDCSPVRSDINVKEVAIGVEGDGFSTSADGDDISFHGDLGSSVQVPSSAVAHGNNKSIDRNFIEVDGSDNISFNTDDILDSSHPDTISLSSVGDLQTICLVSKPISDRLRLKVHSCKGSSMGISNELAQSGNPGRGNKSLWRSWRRWGKTRAGTVICGASNRCGGTLIAKARLSVATTYPRWAASLVFGAIHRDGDSGMAKSALDNFLRARETSSVALGTMTRFDEATTVLKSAKSLLAIVAFGVFAGSVAAREMMNLASDFSGLTPSVEATLPIAATALATRNAPALD